MLEVITSGGFCLIEQFSMVIVGGNRSPTDLFRKSGGEIITRN